MSKIRIYTITDQPISTEATVRLLQYDPSLGSGETVSYNLVNFNIIDDIIDSDTRLDFIRDLDCEIVFYQNSFGADGDNVISSLRAAPAEAKSKYPSTNHPALGKPTVGRLGTSQLVPSGNEMVTQRVQIYKKSGITFVQSNTISYAANRPLENYEPLPNFFDIYLTGTDNIVASGRIYWRILKISSSDGSGEDNPSPSPQTFNPQIYIANEYFKLYRPDAGVAYYGANLNRDRNFVMYGIYERNVDFSYQSIPLSCGQVVALPAGAESVLNQAIARTGSNWSMGMPVNYDPAKSFTNANRPTGIIIQDYHIDCCVYNADGSFVRGDRLYFNTTDFGVLDAGGNEIQRKQQPFPYMKLRAGSTDVSFGQKIRFNAAGGQVVEPVRSFLFMPMQSGQKMKLSFKMTAKLYNDTYTSPATEFSSYADMECIVGWTEVTDRNWKRTSDHHFQFVPGKTRDYILIINTDRSVDTEFTVQTAAAQTLLARRHGGMDTKLLIDAVSIVGQATPQTLYVKGANAGRRFCQMSSQIVMGF